MKNNIPTLSIRAVTEPGLQPFSGILDCQITLADSKNATSIYPVNFTTICKEKTSKSSMGTLILPIPTIGSIGSDGSMTLVWNVDMTIPSSNLSADSGRKLS